MRSWLIEKEGDYFDFRLRSSNFQTQLSVISSLLNENISSLQKFLLHYGGAYKEDFENVFDPVIVFKLDEIPEIVDKKSYFLSDGWAVVELRYLFPYLKRVFERKLKQRTDTFSSHIDKNEEIKEAAEDILSHLEGKYIQMQSSVIIGKQTYISNILV